MILKKLIFYIFKILCGSTQKNPRLVDYETSGKIEATLPTLSDFHQNQRDTKDHMHAKYRLDINFSSRATLPTKFLSQADGDKIPKQLMKTLQINKIISKKLATIVSGQKNIA